MPTSTTTSTSSSGYSLEQIAKLGDQFYLEELKNKLEKVHYGKYVVIEVDNKRYFVDKDLEKAYKKAKKKFPHKLFHIIKIGTLQKLSKHYEWIF